MSADNRSIGHNAAAGGDDDKETRVPSFTESGYGSQCGDLAALNASGGKKLSSRLSMSAAESKTPRMAETWAEMLKRWPYCTFAIAASEFCMVMSALGAILPLYMLNKMNFTESQTVVFFNVQTIFVSILSIVGSVLADGFIGRYRTIMWGTILYSIGKITMAGASMFPAGSDYHPWIDALGLFTLATASGFIGPSTTPFCGDQFPAHETRMLSTFFSVLCLGFFNIIEIQNGL